MTDFGKVAVAFALSVLAHASLFAALALMPVAVTVPASPVPEEKPPLEVIIEAAAPREVDETAAAPDAIHTHLEPENLKKADQAPEQPREIAAHDSEATPPRAEATPSPDLSATLAPVAAPAPLPQPEAEEAGIDALGNYGKAVGNAIGARWEFYRTAQKNLPVGEVRIQFTVDAEGRTSEVKILSNTAAEGNAAIAMRAVHEAKIPPIPSERLAQIPGGRIEITYSFINYPTP